MDSNTSLQNLHSVLKLSKTLIPQKFIWPKEQNHNTTPNQEEHLNEPIIDLQAFIDGNHDSARHTAELVRSACLSHGLFQVINHGVDSKLINSMHYHVKDFFNLPIDEKMRVHRLPGSFWGYSLAHADRFSLNLPWKETISCFFDENGKGPDSDFEATGFFKLAFGEDFEEIASIFQKYCEAMKRLSLTIMEILGMSLGADQSYFKEFFKDGGSIMRCNLYPPCQEPGLALGTGPHCDPTALTILHQDQVGGLQVLDDGKWKFVKPRHDAFVVSLGDTFVALSNGVYKSCPHRALVNKSMERVSLVFFLCPREDKVIVPPENLVTSERPRKYPDFTWSELLQFTQKHYRVDIATLQNFTKWLIAHQTT
ncbi:Iron/ascorbate family oxidoreductase [Handroanthus impetiginosus]|uniref:Iron/ascorbate family oxidoreductase n=1 Tax=Handroanthus impetiginosus TaxID=429701 RepID=A0A2G9GJY2_9LAMI|nr:Iron/ascorbate family oxidoreductase [Handroanthus impetiginosus]